MPPEMWHLGLITGTVSGCAAWDNETMLGEKAYQNALRRRSELRQELERIETFLALCEEYANLPGRPVAFAGEADAPKLSLEGDLTVTRSASAPEEKTQEAIAGMALVPYIRRTILDVGRPLSRGEVVNALAERAIQVGGQDPATNVGTIMWRAKADFVNLKPHGYWPRDVAYAPAGYEPAAGDKTEEEDHVDERRESDSPASQERLWEVAAKGVSGGD